MRLTQGGILGVLAPALWPRSRLLEQLVSLATHRRLEPMVRVTKTLKKHEEGLLAWFRSRITNAMLGAMSGLIRAAKARTPGYARVAISSQSATLSAASVSLGYPFETARSDSGPD